MTQSYEPHFHVFHWSHNMAKFSSRVAKTKLSTIFEWTMSHQGIKFLFCSNGQSPPPVPFSLAVSLVGGRLSIFANHTTNLPIEKSIQVLTWSWEQLVRLLCQRLSHWRLSFTSPWSITHLPPGKLLSLSNQKTVAGGTRKAAQGEAEWLFLVLTAELLFFQAQLTFI